MSLDIHKLINGQPTELLVSISDSEYLDLLPAIETFESRTGLYIDQYGDLKLSSGLQPLTEVLEATNEGKQIYSTILTVLKDAEKASFGIIFIGD